MSDLLQRLHALRQPARADDREEVSRREFLGACLTTTAALTLGSTLLGETAMAAPNNVAAKPDAAKNTGGIPRRPLGRTGFQASILGLGGAWYLGESKDKDNVEKILNAAIDGGINYFDTAGNYNLSEENMGLVMGTKRRKEVFLATKTEERSYDGAMKQFEKSLKSLRTNHVDLLQVHMLVPQDDIAAFGKKDGVLYALRKLRDEKTIRFLGVTGHPEYPRVKECLEMYDDFDTLLCFVNPQFYVRPAFDDQMPVARRKKMGIIAMKVFGGGNPPLLLGEGPGKATPTELLRYAMSQNITTIIPAVSTLEQLQHNIEVAKHFVPMTPEEREALIAKINIPAKKQARITLPYPYSRA